MGDAISLKFELHLRISYIFIGLSLRFLLFLLHSVYNFTDLKQEKPV